MPDAAWVIDVGEADFPREVVDRSATIPVVVDFWAPWCGPCRTLGPLLERLAAEHAGAFLLAKVDVDRAPALAARFGIQSIPAVKAFRDGALVAELTGAQPEPVLRQFLAAVLPSEADRLVATAAAEPPETRASTLAAALALEPRHGGALLALARLHADRGETDEALALLDRVVSPERTRGEAERLAATLRLRHGGGDEAALRRRVADRPDDLDARLALGRTLAALGRHEEGLAELLEVVRRDPAHQGGAARQAMVDVFGVLGNDSPLTDRFRGELAKALFR